MEERDRETEWKTVGKGGKRRDEVANPFYPVHTPTHTTFSSKALLCSLNLCICFCLSILFLSFYIPQISEIIWCFSFSIRLPYLHNTLKAHPYCHKWRFHLFDSWVVFYWVSVYICTYVYHIFFIHSLADRDSGCFHILAIVNSATWTQWYIYLF